MLSSQPSIIISKMLVVNKRMMIAYANLIHCGYMRFTSNMLLNENIIKYNFLRHSVFNIS